jgi:O-antigen ligase
MKKRSAEKKPQASHDGPRSLPIHDAWLPDLNETRTLAVRKRWIELTPAQRNMWLLRVALLIALAVTVAAHPSSAVRDVLVWGSFFYVLFRQRKVLFSKKPDHLSLALLTYVVIFMASVAYSAHRYWSVKDGWKFLTVLLMVFAAWHLFKKRAFLFGFLQLLVAGVLVILICDVITYFIGLGKLWQWGERWVNGPYYGHPNTASAIIMLLIPIAVFLYASSPNKWLKVVHGCLLAVGLFLIYVMASRTVQVSLAAMALCGAILVRPWKRKAVALAAVVCVLLLAFLNLKTLNPRFMDETFRSLTFRDENWRNLSTLIVKRPVFGYGYGKSNYETVYHRSFPGSVVPYHHAHSLVFQTAFETGFVGLAAMLWLWGVVAYRLLRAYARNRNPFGTFCATLFLSFAGISVYFLAEVPDGFLRSLSWLLVAMTGALTRREVAEGKVNSSPQTDPPAD